MSYFIKLFDLKVEVVIERSRFKAKLSPVHRAIISLEQQTKENYIITFGKLLDPNPNQFNLTELLKYMFMICEVQNVMEGTSCGQVMVFDATGFTLGHIGRMNLMTLKKILFFIQEGSPVRLKAIHVINAIPAAETLLNMLKPFVKKELLSIVS